MSEYKLKKLRLKNPDGSLSEMYDIGADAANIDVENKMTLDVKLNNMDEKINANKEAAGAASKMAGENKTSIDNMSEQVAAAQKDIVDLDAIVKTKPYVFNTVADMKKCLTLKDGDACETLGYYEVNDGYFNNYFIRDKKNIDTIDNINIIELQNNLVAVTLQNYNNISIFNIPDNYIEDKIQSILNKDCFKILNFTGTNYVFTKTLILNKNTTLLLNNATLTFNIPTAVENWRLSHGFFNFKTNDEFLEFNGNGNINIIGGTIIGGNCSFCHAENIKIENVNFINCKNNHILEMAGINNLIVKNCNFTGTIKDNSNYKEYIQLDNMTYANFPFLPETNATFDNTTNSNWLIENCNFNKPIDTKYAFYTAIGNHFGVDNKYHTNIKIINNNFNEMYNLGINIWNTKNLLIENNIFTKEDKTGESTVQGSMIRLRKDIINCTINNNIFNGNVRAFETGSPHNISKNITLSNNLFNDYNFIDSDNSGNYALINLYPIDNFKFVNNKVINFSQNVIRINHIEDKNNSANFEYLIDNNTFKSSIKLLKYASVIKCYSGISIIKNNYFSILASEIKNDKCIVLTQDNLTDVIINNNYYNDYILTNDLILNLNHYKKIKNIYDIQILLFNGQSLNLTDQVPNENIFNFNTLIVTLGRGTNTYSYTLKPWQHNRRLESRTYILPTSNSSVILTINQDGTFNYNSNSTNIELRVIEGSNFL